MNRMLISVAGLVVFLSGPPATWAFTTQPVSPETMSNRLADPDELADKMSNGQSSGNYFRGTRGSHDAAVFCTTIERYRQQPICNEPEYGVRAERTSVIR